MGEVAELEAQEGVGKVCLRIMGAVVGVGDG